MVTVFCGDLRCLDRLQLTEDAEYRHTTKRWDDRYGRPDTITLSQIKRRLARRIGQRRSR